MKKNIILTFVFVIVLVVGVLVWQYGMKSTQMTGESEDQQPNQSASKGVVEGAKFVMGQVISVGSGSISFSVSATDERVAVISAGTSLKKQILEKSGGVKVVEARLSDFPTGAPIVVYYTLEPQGNTYQADKIQNIDY